MRRGIAVGVSLLLLGGSGEPPRVEFRLAPIFTAGALTAVAVSIDLAGDADGTTVLELPDDFAGGKQRWRLLGPITATGATVREDGPARRVLTADPGAPIRVRYTVATGYARDPAAGAENPYDGAAIRPAWFASLGEFLFAVPAGRGGDAASFAWTGWPAAWRRVSDLDHPNLTVDAIAESTLLAAPDAVVRTRAITGGVLTLGMRGRWAFDGDAYADTMAKTIGAQRAFWGDVSGPFTVTLFELAASAGRSSSGGTGRSDAFAQYASGDIDAANLLRNIAHEHTHSWIPRRLGETPSGKAEAAVYWFTEGFTDFYTARTLLRAGLWTPEQFVADLNERLLEYAASPVRTVPNARIVEAFWSDPRVGDLPYRRGLIFAHRIDRELRRTSGGRHDLDTLMFRMRDRWVAAPAAAKPMLIENFRTSARALGLDVDPLLARDIEAGADAAVPADAFPGCATVATLDLAAFEPGFDRDTSADTGIIAGVDPRGPAYAAGLRDGMQRRARVFGTEGDSRALLGYRIADARGERIVAWFPAGRARMRVQHVALLPRRAASCARTMVG